MKKEHVTLTDEERSILTALLTKGSLKARTFKRATGLLELDRGHSLQVVAKTLRVNYNTVATWREKYEAGGLDTALYDAPRTGRPIEIDGIARAAHHRPRLHRCAGRAHALEVKYAR